MSDVNLRDHEGAEQPEVSTADLAGVKSPAASREADPQREERVASQDRAATARNEDDAAPLFGAEETAEFRGKWDGIQAGFVDEPRRAVELADGLVAEAMTRLAEIFANERKGLEGQWDRGGDVTTEDLRLALRRYRSFFSRLLSV